MPQATKIATCCYCGTRAALVLKGRERHELACSACGAPLREMKMLHPVSRDAPPPEKRRPPKRAVRRPRPKKRSRLAKKLWDRLEDVLDDLID